MNAVLVTFAILAFVFFWRLFTNFNCVQRLFHCFGPLAVLFQWYTFLFISLGYLLVRTFYDIVLFEYIKYDFLSHSNLIEEKDFIPDLSEEEREALRISPWLRIFSLAAPIAGMLAAIVVVEHVSAVVMASMRRAKMAGARLYWKMSTQVNMILLVIAMPLVFILMAMRAEIRIWAVMTGSAWIPYHEVSPPTTTWKVVRTLEMSTYTSDLELGNFFQYITIFAFGRLCVFYLKDAPAEYRKALKLAGLQGVYLYVIFGAVRSIGNLAVAVLGASEEYSYLSATLRDKTLAQIGPVFSVATLLCVYNMFVLGKMSDIRAHLGSANLKFQATRFLVLISQIQLQVLMGLCVGSKLYQAAQKLPPKYSGIVESWHLSTYRAQLMHAALLNFECLFVVLFNRCVWRSSADYGDEVKAQTSAREPRPEFANAAEPPLCERLLPTSV
mmetsp:Transcript_143743/g.374353  ORF Transcript_143743/g.374353 Transcript_143743/m.374353 type:complete len:442 (+) Transcript_143743:73-1398(+)